jgi:hypothetical protein
MHDWASKLNYIVDLFLHATSIARHVKLEFCDMFFYMSRKNVFLFILCLQYFSIIYQLQYSIWFGASV